MSVQPSMLQFLEDWRRWTIEESQAILAQDWPRVRQCQHAKEIMQPLAPPPGKDEGHPPAEDLCHIVRELLAMEERNRDWLATRQADLAAKRCELEQGVRNLHRVRGSYVRSRQPSWQSYS